MRDGGGGLLERAGTIAAASVVSLILGLCFIFIRAPHPWGQEGFDHYHQLALTLAAGHGFRTMDVPWGYAYFLAVFYRAFGDRPWIPLVVQAGLNALLPWLVFAVARTWLDRRTATLAAVITGICSFNTIYASTQSSDSVCTVIFVAAVALFICGVKRRELRLFVLAGLLFGAAPQFRPNLILVPVVLAVYALVRLGASVLIHAAALVAAAAAVLAPWTVRNYLLTREIVPTSVHSGVQLWYGSLQVGPYLHSRAANPRARFEAPVFTYTSVYRVPFVVTAQAPGCDRNVPAMTLIYWSDRDETPHRVTGARDGRQFTFEIPPLPAPSVLYYYFETRWTTPTELQTTTPPLGRKAPMILFVSRDHLGDMDLHGDVLDVFDVIRMMRHVAWHEPLPFATPLETAGIDHTDIAAAVRYLLAQTPAGNRVGARLFVDDSRARLELEDGSAIVVPRSWNGRITDVEIGAGLAQSLMSVSAPVTMSPSGSFDPCDLVQNIAVNHVFYRLEPHLMRRYFSLAWDNIRRAPGSFVLATVYRAVRLFVIEGSEDRATTQQFTGGLLVYRIGMVLSTVYGVLFLSGVLIARQRRLDQALPLLLIAYVPVTISPMLTNMRYTVTVQPLMFMYVALTLTAMRNHSTSSARRARRGREDTETAHPL